MGARGPLKLPSHLQAVPDASKAADTAASAVPAVAPTKPKAVEEDRELSALWDDIVPELDRAGLVTVSDGPSIELALRHFLMARQAAAAVGGVVAVSDHHNGGTLKKNPAEAVFRAESDMFLKYAQQLGMTFVSRARTPVESKGSGSGENPFGQAVG